MISESDKLSRTAKNAEKTSALAGAAPNAPANMGGIAQNAFLPAAAGRPGGARAPVEKRGARINQVLAKAAAKGARPAAHGHSRHK